MSSRTGADGQFRFADVWQPTVAVTATTKDGRIAILPAVVRGTEDLTLPALEAGAILSLEMVGRPSARVALFDGDVRFEDFTLRDGKPQEIVLPARPVRVKLYGQDLEDVREISIEPGGSTEMRFEVTAPGTS